MEEVVCSAGLRALIRWNLEMGADLAVGEAPIDRFARTAATGAETARHAVATSARVVQTVSSPSGAFSHSRNSTAPQPVVAISATTALPADEAVALAREAAAAAADLDALRAAVLGFTGCSLKAGARSTVFAEGVPGPRLLVIGEAPGREEDETGRPFVGRAGQLLDKMLASIGYSRQTNTLISNVIFWRPPGNRAPTQVEMAICQPFVDRLIELSAPKAVLLAGGAPTQALLGLAGITRVRGGWRQITTGGGTITPAMPSFHPAFLLRQPQQKRIAWRDLLSLEARLSTG